MDITLRAARPDDRDFLYAVRRDGFRAYAEQAFGPWDDTKMRAHAEEEFAELPVEIIERAGEPIGYQIIVRHADHWFLDEIALVAAERRRGLGSELVTTVMTAARAVNLPLRLSVLATNPAQHLYERLGFRVTCVEPPRIKMEWP